MSLLSNAGDEMRRSPVATLTGLAGVFIAGLGLLVAWTQFQSPAVSSLVSDSTARIAAEFNPANLLLVVSYFIAITVTTAIVLRVVARKHDLATFVASIPVVALTNFSAITVIYLSPPRPMSQNIFTSAHDLVFYASAAIVMTFCGGAVMREIFAPSRNIPKKDGEAEEETNVIGAVHLALIVLTVWSALVFAGQTRLTRTLLPEIAHPIEVKVVKAAG